MHKRREWVVKSNQPPSFTFSQIAEALSVSESTVKEWVMTGELTSCQIEINNSYQEVINAEELYKWLACTDYKKVVQAKIKHLEKESRAYYLLYQWQKAENESLMSLYKSLNDVFVSFSEKVKEMMNDSAYATSTSARIAYQMMLRDTYSHWRQPKEKYQIWLTEVDERWRIFEAKSSLTTNDDSMFQPDPVLDDFPLLHVYPQVNPSGAINIAKVEQTRSLYHNLFNWAKEEHTSLLNYYKQMDHSLTKLVKILETSGQRKIKNLDVDSGQVYIDGATSLQIQWEVARSGYFQWLQEKSQRWHLKRNEIAEETVLATEVETSAASNELSISNVHGLMSSLSPYVNKGLEMSFDRGLDWLFNKWVPELGASAQVQSSWKQLAADYILRRMEGPIDKALDIIIDNFIKQGEPLSHEKAHLLSNEILQNLQPHFAKLLKNAPIITEEKIDSHSIKEGESILSGSQIDSSSESVSIQTDHSLKQLQKSKLRLNLADRDMTSRTERELNNPKYELAFGRLTKLRRTTSKSHAIKGGLYKDKVIDKNKEKYKDEEGDE